METQTPNVQPDYPPDQPKPNWLISHKILYSVIGVLLLIVIVGAAYWWKMEKQTSENLQQANQNQETNPNSTDSIDWKTYMNTEYGFEFKYPTNWTKSENSNGVTLTMFGPGVHNPDDGVFSDGARITFSGANSLTEDIKNNTTNWKGAVRTFSEYGFIGSVIYDTKKPEHDWGSGIKAYSVSENGKVVHLDWSSSNSFDNTDFNHQKDLLPILATFRFTETAGVKTYTSQKLGVSFQYLVSQGDPIIEEGNKIYVGGKDGQWVEVFSKNSNDDLAAAIKKQLLANISEKDCYVETYPARSGFSGPNYYPSNYEMASISYPVTDPENFLEAMENTKCPKTYQSSNGVSYFLADKNYPSKFFFFSIGQYAILAEPGNINEGKKTWQDTFKVN